MRNLKWIGITTTALVLSVATQASADSPATANSFQWGIGFRYGFSMNDNDAVNPNPWGAGLGANVGFTLPNAVYVGGVFDYFFGGSEELASTGGGIKFSANIWQVMGEGGYDIGVANLVIRPKIGAGYASANAKACLGDTCASNSTGNFALAPGAGLMLFFPGFRILGDVRYDLVFADTTAKAVIVTAGVGF